MILVLLFLISLLNPTPAFAHSFGQLYTLPIPFWLYLYASAAALLVSFLIIGYFASSSKGKNSYQFIKLPSVGSQLFNSRYVKAALKIAALIFLFITIAYGQMVFFWIYFVVGFAYISAIFGNIYALINPFKTLCPNTKGKVKYPNFLSYYPAVFLYVVFIWVELFVEGTPARLTYILAGYTILTFIASLIFGKENWFKFGDFFSIFFKLISKISIFEIHNQNLHLRPPFVSLSKVEVKHFSLLLFILFMLSSTAFDGIHQTTPYVAFYWQNINGAIRPIFGADAFLIFQLSTLVLSPFIFLSIYLFAISASRSLTKSKLKTMQLAQMFAPSLIPIAFVYHFAHYFTLLFSEGLNIILPANFVWHTQVAAILIGHIAAVLIAHLIAVDIFQSRQKSLISQMPMLILMVIYTMIGLWILSQPLSV